MRKSIVVGALAPLACPAAVWTQDSASGVVIDHKAVSCIVAGKYPKMDACFTPSPEVARARVYFRAEGGTSWYYVEMKAAERCMAGILPKPRKELIDKHVDYYVQVTDRNFSEGRTEEYNPLVVAKESDCGDKPVAGWLSKASVKVFPTMPVAFTAGGLGAGAAIGGGLALAGVAAGVYAATNDGNGTTTTTMTSGGTVPTPPSPSPSPSPSPTMPPAPQGWRFRFKVTPNQGTDPLDVTVDMCDSVPETSLKYFYDFNGDGVEDFQGPFCSQTRTFHVKNVDVFPAGLPPTPPPTPNPRPKTWTVQGCAEPRDDALEPQERRCGTATVRVEPAETTATTLRTSLTGSAQTALAWKSELLVPGASGQIVANGVAAAFASSGQGPVSGVVASRPGPNRIEAQLVQANGKPGTWRFDLSLTSGLVAGSLRVVAGEAVAVTADAIVFGMRGAPGERIVFTFETAN